jgi:hypothetical protein
MTDEEINELTHKIGKLPQLYLPGILALIIAKLEPESDFVSNNSIKAQINNMYENWSTPQVDNVMITKKLKS